MNETTAYGSAQHSAPVTMQEVSVTSVKISLGQACGLVATFAFAIVIVAAVLGLVPLVVFAIASGVAR